MIYCETKDYNAIYCPVLLSLVLPTCLTGDELV